MLRDVNRAAFPILDLWVLSIEIFGALGIMNRGFSSVIANGRLPLVSSPCGVGGEVPCSARQLR